MYPITGPPSFQPAALDHYLSYYLTQLTTSTSKDAKTIDDLIPTDIDGQQNSVNQFQDAHVSRVLDKVIDNPISTADINGQQNLTHQFQDGHVSNVLDKVIDNPISTTDINDQQNSANQFQDGDASLVSDKAIDNPISTVDIKGQQNSDNQFQDGHVSPVLDKVIDNPISTADMNGQQNSVNQFQDRHVSRVSDSDILIDNPISTADISDQQNPANQFQDQAIDNPITDDMSDHKNGQQNSVNQSEDGDVSSVLEYHSGWDSIGGQAPSVEAVTQSAYVSQDYSSYYDHIYSYVGPPSVGGVRQTHVSQGWGSDYRSSYSTDEQAEAPGFAVPQTYVSQSNDQIYNDYVARPSIGDVRQAFVSQVSDSNQRYSDGKPPTMNNKSASSINGKDELDLSIYSGSLPPEWNIADVRASFG